jgi:hypothetical protein
LRELLANVSERLRVYLRLEEVMMRLDDAGDALAEAMRDELDLIWYSLSDEEVAYLDQRVFGVEGEEASPDDAAYGETSKEIESQMDDKSLAESLAEKKQ